MIQNNLDIKNLDVRKKMWESTIARRGQYVDHKTGLFFKDLVENRNCPVCNSSQSKLMFHKFGGTYVKCAHCEMIFTNPVPKDDFLIDYYSTNHSVQAEVVGTDREFYDCIYQKGIDLFKKNDGILQSVLDYGCSSGTFLDIARKSGFSETFGVELNEVERARAVSRGHVIFDKDLRGSPLPHRFSLITLWDVFEHLKDGKAYLKEFGRHLDIGGAIFLQVPNGYALAAQMLQDKCNMFDGLEHVNLYNCRNIAVLAEQCGFKVASIQSVIAEVKVMTNYLNYEDPYSGDWPPVIFPAILDEKEILDNLLGYKLQIVLKKTESMN